MCARSAPPSRYPRDEQPGVGSNVSADRRGVDVGQASSYCGVHAHGEIRSHYGRDFVALPASDGFVAFAARDDFVATVTPNARIHAKNDAPALLDAAARHLDDDDDGDDDDRPPATVGDDWAVGDDLAPTPLQKRHRTTGPAGLRAETWDGASPPTSGSGADEPARGLSRRGQHGGTDGDRRGRDAREPRARRSVARGVARGAGPHVGPPDFKGPGVFEERAAADEAPRRLRPHAGVVPADGPHALRRRYSAPRDPHHARRRRRARHRHAAGLAARAPPVRLGSHRGRAALGKRARDASRLARGDSTAGRELRVE
mmetsp:Transcript_34079/g.119125  ORF Transcript_34079/g.119125 Transcript_34079/m.119125 type:complete len:315 (+) Transcript_34079:359-1303(+)